jgi:nicotinate dehydrogenase subunit A
MTPVSSFKRSRITTLEGLGTPARPHPIQQAWIEEQAVQCGFCTNGQIMQAKVLLDRKPNPTEPEIRQALDRVLCRCGAYYRIIRAVRRAGELMRTTKGQR